MAVVHSLSLWGLFTILWVAGPVDLTGQTLSGTEQLRVDRPLDEVMVEGLQRFCLRELAAARELRAAKWKPHLTSAQMLSAHVSSRRDKLRSLIGAVDARVTTDSAASAAFELQTTLDRSSVIARNQLLTVHQVRWPVIRGISGEGLLLVPQTVRAGVVVIPDADWTPEMFCGLVPGTHDLGSLVQRLAEAGCLVVIPTLISRHDEYSGHPNVGFTNQPHREFIYRQAFEVGRHIIGYDVQKVLAAVDLLEQQLKRSNSASSGRRTPIGVAGFGEGGLISLYSSALDERINTCWVSGYFQQREGLWQEPIYRNVWGLLTEFGDAELAGMIAPRRLTIEACRVTEVAGPPAARAGRTTVAAPGRIATCSLESVQQEVTRARDFYAVTAQPEQLVLVVNGEQGAGAPGHEQATLSFVQELGLVKTLTATPHDWSSESVDENQRRDWKRLTNLREQRQMEELQNHVQKLILDSHQVRDARWRLNPAQAAEWKQNLPKLRDWVHEELIGRLPQTRLPLRPRSRSIIETKDYHGYELVLDVYEDVIASGILLVPSGLREGERRPVIVCQHGLEGRPHDTLSRQAQDFKYYKALAEELVQQGYIVYAPQNPYRGGDKFRVLQRMSNPLQRSLFSYVIAQHEQTLDWLTTLPFADPDRIAFYGLSYGGKTAMRVPPFVERYKVSICSGDFTDWPRTIASNNERFSYLFSSEYEVFEWNLAHVASYAELAMLMTPRAFMVEEGHRDGGQPTEWVAGEFGKVRRHYDQLGLSDQAVIEFFDGPHTIHGQGTFQFLKTQLNAKH